MPAAVRMREDYSAEALRSLAKRSKSSPCGEGSYESFISRNQEIASVYRCRIDFHAAIYDGWLLGPTKLWHSVGLGNVDALATKPTRVGQRPLTVGRFRGLQIKESRNGKSLMRPLR